MPTAGGETRGQWFLKGDPVEGWVGVFKTSQPTSFTEMKRQFSIYGLVVDHSEVSPDSKPSSNIGPGTSTV